MCFYLPTKLLHYYKCKLHIFKSDWQTALDYDSISISIIDSKSCYLSTLWTKTNRLYSHYYEFMKLLLYFVKLKAVEVLESFRGYTRIKPKSPVLQYNVTLRWKLWNYTILSYHGSKLLSVNMLIICMTEKESGTKQGKSIVRKLM